MIRKTVKVFNRIRPNLENRGTGRGHLFEHMEKVIKITYWFLFIPIYTKECVEYDKF